MAGVVVNGAQVSAFLTHTTLEHTEEEHLKEGGNAGYFVPPPPLPPSSGVLYLLQKSCHYLLFPQSSSLTPLFQTFAPFQTLPNSYPPFQTFF